MVKNPLAMWETQIQSLGQEDPLEKRMTTTLVFLPGESHGQSHLAGYIPCGQRVGHGWATNTSLLFTSLHWALGQFVMQHNCNNLLRVPWTARSNQSILKEISPEYSLEGLMLKLKLQYFGHLIQRTDSLEKKKKTKKPWCWKGLKAGGEEDVRGWDGWMASPTQWTWLWVNSGSWWWTGRPGVLQSMGSQRVRHDWVTELTEAGLFVSTLGLW